MRYLLYVNALVVLGFDGHEQHNRVARLKRELALPGLPEFGTGSITELGLIRIPAQVREYGFTVAQARKLLLDLKSAESVDFTFLPDDQDTSELPDWVVRLNQTTNRDVVQLAKANGAALATLDAKIPGAYLIRE